MVASITLVCECNYFMGTKAKHQVDMLKMVYLLEYETTVLTSISKFIKLFSYMGYFLVLPLGK